MLRRAILAALAAALLLPAAAAAAPDTVVDFEGIPVNTAIQDQYAGSGVRFGAAQDFGFPPPVRGCGTPSSSAPGVSGISARIDCRTGSNEFPTRFFGTAIEFATERRALSFKIFQRTTDTPITTTISAYAIGGVLLEQHTIALSRNVVVPQSFSHATTDGGIVGIVISGDLDMYDSDGVFVDDLVATLDDVPPPKKFSLALSTPSIDVVEGSIGESTLSVRRYNGSTGPVTLSVGALPPGVVASNFTTNPVNGTDPTKLRVTGALPFAGPRQLTVTATGGAQAGTAIGASLVQTVTGVPALQFATGGRFPIRLVPGCGAQAIPDSVNVRGELYDSASVDVLDKSGGVTGRADPGGASFYGNGVYPLGMSLDPGTADGGGELTLKVTPFHATPTSIKLSWITDRVSVSSVAPLSPALPLAENTAAVTVVGNFPSRCPVTFVDGAGQEWPVKDRQPASVDVGGRLMDAWTLTMPTTAVSGPLRVLSPAKAELTRTAPIDVREFRNVFAVRQVNGGDGAKGTYNWNDFVRTFGDDDSEACFIFCVRDPLAIKYYDRFRGKVEGANGLCTGYAIMAARFHGFNNIFKQSASDYLPGAKRAWDIVDFRDGTEVKRDIVRWWVAQNDQSFLKARQAGIQRGAAAEAKLLRDLIAEQGVAVVTISQGTSGHAVLAYGVQDAGNGALKVAIYDPNIPYMANEATDKTVRANALTNSSILIQADGSWKGSSLTWSGPNERLAVVDTLPPENAALPDGSVVLPSANSAAGVAAIETGGKTVYTDGKEPAKGSGVQLDPTPTGVKADPAYRLEPGRAYDFTLRGTATGTVDDGLLGQDAAAQVSGAKTKPGQVDHMIVRPGQASLEFSTGAASTGATYDLVDQAGKATRTASVKVTARNGGSDAVELGGGTLRLAHEGAPTKATITLGSVGEGLPGSVTTTAMAVGRGQSLELKPAKWSDLGAGVKYAVRTAGGRVLRRGAARLKTTTRVAVGGVSAKRKGKVVTVKGRVTRRGTAPVLAATVEYVRGGKVVGRKSATLRGAKVRKGGFTLKVTLGRVPSGAKPRVTVVLLDEAAGLASVRKTVKVR